MRSYSFVRIVSCPTRRQQGKGCREACKNERNLEGDGRTTSNYSQERATVVTVVVVVASQHRWVHSLYIWSSIYVPF